MLTIKIPLIFSLLIKVHRIIRLILSLSHSVEKMTNKYTLNEILKKIYHQINIFEECPLQAQSGLTGFKVRYEREA